MSDIFLSYESEDRERVMPLIHALGKTGWSVFWDRTIPTGKTWRDVIGREIRNCRSIVVVWSKTSIDSEWVQEEAEEGKRRQVLFPVSIDNVLPPFGFGSIQAADLTSWAGTTPHPAFDKFISDIAGLLGSPPVAVEEEKHKTQEEERKRAQEEAKRKAKEEQLRAEAEAKRKAKDEAQRLEQERRNREARERAAKEKAKREPATSQTAPPTPPRVSREPTPQRPEKPPIWLAVAAISLLLLAGGLWYASDQQQKRGEAEALQQQAEQQAKEAQAKQRALEEAQRKAEAKRKAALARQPRTVFQDKLKDGSNGPEMVIIAPGEFEMGDIQGDGAKDERPVHTVRISKPFAIGKYEVTWDEFKRFARATNLGKDARGQSRHPVVFVDWKDARAYANWLSQETGKRYRLPTEAEWEYAARAGTTTRYWWGNAVGKNRANCEGCGSQWDDKQAAPTAPVGSFAPNPFGLYDTAGNVWEWNEDCLHKDYKGAPGDGTAWGKEDGGDCRRRGLRGGSWASAESLRSSERGWGAVDNWFSFLGFRLARDL